MAKFPRISAPAALLLTVMLLQVLAVPLHADDEVQSWYSVLNIGGKAINQMIAIQMFAMVGVLCCVGWVLEPIWRGAVGALICIGIQIFKDPRILTNPTVAFSERFSRVGGMGMSEKEVLANVALGFLILFIFLLIMDVYLACKPANQSTPGFGVKSAAHKAVPTVTTAASTPPPPPDQRKSIFD